MIFVAYTVADALDARFAAKSVNVFHDLTDQSEIHTLFGLSNTDTWRAMTVEISESDIAECSRVDTSLRER